MFSSNELVFSAMNLAELLRWGVCTVPRTGALEVVSTNRMRRMTVDCLHLVKKYETFVEMGKHCSVLHPSRFGT